MNIIPPKLLICSRCNHPGHTKKSCQNSNYDICRRCGADRNDQHNHQECEIKCHHCNGSHVSTEYKCPVINQYRGELIYELRKRSDKLPVDVQLFIPSEYRNSDERNKVIYNKKAQQQKQRQDEQRYNRNDYNAWPSVNSNVTTLVPLSPSYQTLNETIKSLDNALNALKQDYLQEQQKIEQKYKEHLNGINQGWLIMQQQMQTQTQILSTMHDAINQTLFTTCQKTMLIMGTVLNKIKIQMNTNEYDETIQQLAVQITYINENQKSYTNHQTSLEQLLSKQTEALNKAFDIFLNPTNE
ncbi:unnamed protein product [Didymodactylos carnosus]|uniref:CCHC-type domain-containing protein n=2 Tax=Didymodactylos carnosus TaxID=1234261 RepID=A0A8S2CZN1_9BILA|nr:unnamed protein product [Didymodactylos carnosus]CAF3587643.1 unnamed protein product [Didymodactylos carnosus]